MVTTTRGMLHWPGAYVECSSSKSFSLYIPQWHILISKTFYRRRGPTELVKFQEVITRSARYMIHTSTQSGGIDSTPFSLRWRRLWRELNEDFKILRGFVISTPENISPFVKRESWLFTPLLLWNQGYVLSSGEISLPSGWLTSRTTSPLKWS